MMTEMVSVSSVKVFRLEEIVNILAFGEHNQSQNSEMCLYSETIYNYRQIIVLNSRSDIRDCSHVNILF